MCWVVAERFQVHWTVRKRSQVCWAVKERSKVCWAITEIPGALGNNREVPGALTSKREACETGCLNRQQQEMGRDSKPGRRCQVIDAEARQLSFPVLVLPLPGSLLS